MADIHQWFIMCVFALIGLVSAGTATANPSEPVVALIETYPTSNRQGGSVPSSVRFYSVETGALRKLIETIEMPYVASAGRGRFIVASVTDPPWQPEENPGTRLLLVDGKKGVIEQEYVHTRPLATFYAPSQDPEDNSNVKYRDGIVWLITISKNNRQQVEGLDWETKKTVARYVIPKVYEMRARIFPAEGGLLVIHQHRGEDIPSKLAYVPLQGDTRVWTLPGNEVFHSFRESDDRVIGFHGSKLISLPLNKAELLAQNDFEPRIRNQVLPIPVAMRSSFCIKLPDGFDGEYAVSLLGSKGLERVVILDDDKKRNEHTLPNVVGEIVVVEDRVFGLSTDEQSLVEFTNQWKVARTVRLNDGVRVLTGSP